VGLVDEAVDDGEGGGDVEPLDDDLALLGDARARRVNRLMTAH
jgi:hypothetical protein